MVLASCFRASFQFQGSTCFRVFGLRGFEGFRFQSLQCSVAPSPPLSQSLPSLPPSLPLSLSLSRSLSFSLLLSLSLSLSISPLPPSVPPSLYLSLSLSLSFALAMSTHTSLLKKRQSTNWQTTRILRFALDSGHKKAALEPSCSLTWVSSQKLWGPDIKLM